MKRRWAFAAFLSVLIGVLSFLLVLVTPAGTERSLNQASLAVSQHAESMRLVFAIASGLFFTFANVILFAFTIRVDKP